MDQQVQELLDKQAIQELLWQYCRCVDRRDFSSLKGLYLADAIDEHGGMFSGNAHEFVDVLPEIMGPMEITMHFLTNLMITVAGGEAEGEISSIAWHRYTDESGAAMEFIAGGRYFDRYKKIDGKWYFAHRKIVMDWNNIKPSTCDMQSPIVAGIPQGGHGDADPAKAFFSPWFWQDNVLKEQT